VTFLANKLLKKFEAVADLRVHCNFLKKEGYAHYLIIRPRRVTIGSIDNEWRPLIGAVFFKSTIPTFSSLKGGSVQESMPIIEQRKFYSQMSSIGKGHFCATLEPQEIASWIEFFESREGEVEEIENLL